MWWIEELSEALGKQFLLFMENSIRQWLLKLETEIVRFWEENCVGEDSLQLLFPSLYRISSSKARPISDFSNLSGLPVGGPISWNFHFLRNLSDREITQVQELLQRLERQRLCPSVEDKRIWIADSSSIFSCKSAFAWLRKDGYSTVDYTTKCIWKLSIPIKVKVLIWLLVSDKLGVHSNLQRKRLFQSLSPGWCVLCKKDRESTDHIFLNCDFSF